MCFNSNIFHKLTAIVIIIKQEYNHISCDLFSTYLFIAYSLFKKKIRLLVLFYKYYLKSSVIY